MYELELNFSWITWGNTKNQNSTHPQHTKINMNPLYSSRIRMMNIGTSNIGWLIKTLVVVAYCIVNPWWLHQISGKITSFNPAAQNNSGMHFFSQSHFISHPMADQNIQWPFSLPPTPKEETTSLHVILHDTKVQCRMLVLVWCPNHLVHSLVVRLTPVTISILEVFGNDNDQCGSNLKTG